MINGEFYSLYSGSLEDKEKSFKFFRKIYGKFLTHQDILGSHISVKIYHLERQFTSESSICTAKRKKKKFFPENPKRNLQKPFWLLQMNVQSHVSNNENNNFSSCCASLRSVRFDSAQACDDGVWCENTHTVSIWNKYGKEWHNMVRCTSQYCCTK